MIDTVKIYTEISKEVCNIIYDKSIVKLAVNNNTNEKL